MRSKTTALLALLVLLVTAVGAKVAAYGSQPTSAATVPFRLIDEIAASPPYPILRVISTPVRDIDGLVYQVPSCAEPVVAFYVPTYLSAIDVRDLGVGPGYAALYFYGGHRLAGTAINATITAMRFAYRLGRSLRVSPDTRATEYAVKLLVPDGCRDEAARQLDATPDRLFGSSSS